MILISLNSTWTCAFLGGRGVTFSSKSSISEETSIMGHEFENELDINILRKQIRCRQEDSKTNKFGRLDHKVMIFKKFMKMGAILFRTTNKTVF